MRNLKWSSLQEQYYAHILQGILARWKFRRKRNVSLQIAYLAKKKLQIVVVHEP